MCISINWLRKDRPRRDLLQPALPDILTTRLPRPILGILLVAIVGLDGLLAHLGRVALGAHAEPEVIPLLAARAHLAVPIHGVPLAAHAVARPREVEGLAA